MHTLFALITLALAAAVFAWEGLCCLRTGDFRAELSRRFSCEHALFGDFCWGQRQKLAGPLYFAALFVLLFGRIFLHASQLISLKAAAKPKSAKISCSYAGRIAAVVNI